MIIVCCGILLPNFGEYCPFLAEKVLAVRPLPVIGFIIKILVEAALNG
jgi:hypothetical protein